MNRTTRSAAPAPRPPLTAAKPPRVLNGGRIPFLPILALLFANLVFASTAKAATPLTLEQLKRDPNLTPNRLMSYFRDFEFKLNDKRQAPEKFLASRSGDCDDFAALAAEVLREKKYTTRLIAVFMKDQTHVVCYVEEVHGYLDFNRRAEACPVQSAGGKLEEVADRVAASFHSAWRSVCEFTYQADCPQYQQIVFR